MAALTYINSTERIVGENHPQFQDTKNRAGIALNANFIVEHDQTGRHRAQDYALVGEIGTYTGDGLSSQVIALTNDDLEIKWICVWADNSGWLMPETTDTVTAGETFYRSDTTFSTNHINSISTLGQFTVGGNVDVNTNSTTYYYIVIGIDTTSTYTGTPSGSDPTWITSSTSNLMIGDGTSTVSSGNIANNVESTINTRFGVAHNTTTGVHTTNPYAGFAKVETGSFVRTGGTQVITLSDSTFDIKYVMYAIDTAGGKATSANEDMSMPNAKIEDTAAFTTARIQSIGTGTWSVQTTNDSNITHWIAIGV